MTSIDLDIHGMTCASCAARVEKKLNKVDGVSASVNYATEKAHVLAPPGLTQIELIKVVQDAGYDASIPVPEAPPIDRAAGIRADLIPAVVLTVPAILVAMVPALQFPGWQWASAVLALVVVLWCGRGFHRSALVNLRHGATTMDTLISMGTLAALLFSLVALFFTPAGAIGFTHGFDLRLSRDMVEANVYFESAMAIITFILAGRYIEANSRREAGSALRALMQMGAKQVDVIRDGVESTVGIDQLLVGDHFVVRPGAKIATDGVVLDGSSAVDNSLVTGESMPVEVTPGDRVIGATLNTSGRLLVRATAVGADTELAGIARLVEQAQTGKAAAQRLADTISGIFVPIVLVISLLTLIGWLLAGAGIDFALPTAITVLIIACPCALGLATPTALLAGTGRGARIGVVIRGPEVLESAHDIDTIVLDKTGTLTSGVMTQTGVSAASGTTTDQVQWLAGSLEAHASHPIASAIVRATRDAGIELASVESFSQVAGGGVAGRVAGRDVLAGNPAFIANRGHQVPAGLVSAIAKAQDAGRSVVVVAWDGQVRGILEVGDSVKPDAARAIRTLRDLGLQTVMLTGDNRGAADAVAAQLGIDRVHAQVLPADKLRIVTELQAAGHKVAMAGDGVNDAAALTQADLGIAMGTGTDVAIASSDITLMRPDLMLAADSVRLSRATLRTIKQNLFWAFFYNVAAIPLAALGFLNPIIAGAAMGFSSVFVVSNSVRLTRFAPLAG